MSKITRIHNGVNHEFVNDTFGDEDEALQQNESPNNTHFRHHQEENEYRRRNGMEPKNYEPLEED